MRKLVAFFSLLLVAIFWGASFISSELVLQVISPSSLGFYRYLFATAFLLLLFFIKKETFHIEKRDIFLLILSSLIGVVVYFFAENTAILYISGATSSILISTLPIFMVFTNFILYKERITKLELFAIVLSIIGVVLVVHQDFDEFNASTLWGYLSMVVAIIAWIVFSLTTMQLRKRYSNLKVITLQAIIALIVFAPISLLTETNVVSLTLPLWANIVFLGIVCSGIAFYLYVYAMKIVGTTTSSVVINFIPAVTIITSVIVLGTTFFWEQLLGGSLIILSVMFLVLDELRKMKRGKGEVQ